MNYFHAEIAPTLKISKAELKSYMGEVIKILGGIQVANSSVQEPAKKLNLLVVAGEGPSLLCLGSSISN